MGMGMGMVSEEVLSLSFFVPLLNENHDERCLVLRNLWNWDWNEGMV